MDQLEQIIEEAKTEGINPEGAGQVYLLSVMAYDISKVRHLEYRTEHAIKEVIKYLWE